MLDSRFRGNERRRCFRVTALFARADRVHTLGRSAFGRGCLHDRLHRCIGDADRRGDDFTRVAGDSAATGAAIRSAERDDTQARARPWRTLIALRSRIALRPRNAGVAFRSGGSRRPPIARFASLAARSLRTDRPSRAFEAAGQEKCRRHERRYRQNLHRGPLRDELCGLAWQRGIASRLAANLESEFCAPPCASATQKRRRNPHRKCAGERCGNARECAHAPALEANVQAGG